MDTIKISLEEIAGFESLFDALQKAMRGKWKKSGEVANFLLKFEEELIKLNEELNNRRYKHSSYKNFYIYDPKKRLISVPAFRDRIVHHAVHDNILPKIQPLFIKSSHACLPGRGMHSAWKEFRNCLDKKENKWILHGDIKKFFPSINREILKKLLNETFVGDGLIWLLEEIVNSAAGIQGFHKRGIPIGNLTSQFFANFYLHVLDIYAAHVLGIKSYIRYMDDFWIFGESKEALKEIRTNIAMFLDMKLNLTLHPEKSEILRKNKAHMNVLCWQLYGKRRLIRMRIWNRMKARLNKREFLNDDYAAIGMYLGLLMP